MRYLQKLAKSIPLEDIDDTYEVYGEVIEILIKKIMILNVQDVYDNSGFSFDGDDEDIQDQKCYALHEYLSKDDEFKKAYDAIKKSTQVDFCNCFENLLGDLIDSGKLKAVKMFRNFLVEAGLIDDDFEDSL